MSFSEVARVVEAAVSVPRYTVIGVAAGKLVYISDEGGFRSLWAVDPRTGSRRRLVGEPVHWAARPRPDCSVVVYTKDVSGGRELQKVFYVDVESGEGGLWAEAEPARVIGMAFDGKRVAYSAASMEEAWICVGERGSLERVHVFERGRAFVTDFQGDVVVGYGCLRGDPRSSELFILRVSKGEFEVYTPREGTVNKAPVLMGSRVLFETNFFGRNRLAVLDLETGELEEAKLGGEYEAFSPAGHVDYGWLDGEGLWAIAKRDGRTGVFVDGKIVPLPQGYADSATVHGGKLYVSLSSLVSPWRIYEVDLETLESRVLIDNALPEEVAEGLGEVRFVRYKSFDGLEVPAFVVESRRAPKPGPTVVYVHGGPWWEVADYWSPLIASLVASGFHVVAPNFRGSTGYGEEYRLMDIGDPGGGDLEDVVRAARWARESGLASEVAVAGYSYGGFMTFLATVKRPEVWSCGVAGAGITDWEEMYGLSDAYFRHFIDILFAGKRELFRDRSAINFAERLSAPLCIIHPQNDSRTPLKPVLHYIERLSELGKLFEVHILPGIGHMLARVEDIAAVAFHMVVFLKKHLGARKAVSA